MRTKLLTLAAFTLVLGIAVAAAQWTMQPQQSELRFTGTQDGVPFEAVFQKFTADIKFDPQDLTNSRFDVKIDLTSVHSGDEDRDFTIKSADLFDVHQWPSSHYVADRFTDKGAGKFAATGKLTLRDITLDVPIEFTFEKDKDGAWLRGAASLKRLDFGVGQGDWSDTSSVANDVKVRFDLLLKQQ